MSGDSPSRRSGSGATAYDPAAEDGPDTDGTHHTSGALGTPGTTATIDSHGGSTVTNAVARRDPEVAAAHVGTRDPAEKSVQNEVGVYVSPQTGPSDLANLPGPFTARQLARIDEALTLGSQETGVLFSVYLGELARPGRAAAEKLAARLPKTALSGSVLLAISPGQRELHVVTVAGATKRLPNRVCALAALGMRAAFSGGDLTAGIVNGVRMLADAAGSRSDGQHTTGQAAGQ